jgi:hypothetical protein
MDDHANRDCLEGHMPFQYKPPRREQLMMPFWLSYTILEMYIPHGNYKAKPGEI